MRPCTKVRYRSEGHALEAARRYRIKGHRDASTLRAYECEGCGGFHLTHTAPIVRPYVPPPELRRNA